MQNAYEALFIVDAAFPQDQVSAIVDKYVGVLTGQNAQVDDIDRWEARRLAYEVKGKREGFYVAINYLAEPAACNELDRIFRISDDTLRHLITRVDKRADRFPSKVRAADTERRERAMAAAAANNPNAGNQPVTDLPLSGSEGTGGVEEANGVSDNTERVGEPLPPNMANGAEDGDNE